MAVQSIIDDLSVLTLPEIAKAQRTSLSTLQRLIAAGEGPKIIQIGKRRIGVRVIDYRPWSESRVRS
jgi:predicted DNA-binding transcriptional regulator AlpA